MHRFISALAAAAALAVPWTGGAADHPVVFEFGPPESTEEAYAEVHHEVRDLAMGALADIHGWFVAAGRQYDRAGEVEDTRWMACVHSPLAGLDELRETAVDAEQDLREALCRGDDEGATHHLSLLRIACERAAELGDEAASCDASLGHGAPGELGDPGEPVLGLHERPWYIHQPLAAPGLDVHGAGSSIQGRPNAAAVHIGPHTDFAPGLALSTTADSNVTSSGSEARRDLRFQLLPHVRLSLDSDAVVLGVEGEYGLDKIAGIGAPDAGGGDGGFGLDRLTDGHAGMDLIAAPHGPVSLVLGDHLVHLTRVGEAGVGTGGTDVRRLGALTNRARIGARVRPTSALAFTGLLHLDLGRHSTAAVVDDEAQPAELHSAYTDVWGGVAATWRFIPHTQVRAEADLGRLAWSEDALVSHLEALHWRIRGGVEGDLSRTVGFRLIVGVSGATASEENDGERGRWRDLVGDAWLTWRPHPAQQFSLGYLRDTRPVHLGDSLLGSSAALRYQGMIAGQVLPTAELVYSRYQIRGADPRDDHEIRARAAVVLAPDDRFRVAVHYDLRALVATQHGAPFTDHRVGLTLELGAPGANLPWIPTLPRSL